MVHLVISTNKEKNNHINSIKLEKGKKYDFEITVDGGHGNIILAINGKVDKNVPTEGLTEHKNIRMYVSDKYQPASNVILSKMSISEIEST